MPELSSEMVVEKSELLYVLVTLHVSSMLGVDNSDLFPPDKATYEARLKEGFEKLQEHGWLKRVDPQKPRRLDPNPELFQAVAVIGDPDVVILTARNVSAQGRQLVNHYLDSKHVIEFAEMPGDRYRLTPLPNRLVMYQRIEALLGVNELGNPPQVQFTLDKETFTHLEKLINTGQRDQAAQLVQTKGLGTAETESLLKAMEASDSSGGAIVIVKQRTGQAPTGKKTLVLKEPGAIWLASGQEDAGFALETLQANMFAARLDGYLAAVVKQ